MSRGKEKIDSLEANRGSSQSISTPPTYVKLRSIKSRPTEDQPRTDLGVSSEIQSKLICGVREDIIKFKVEGVTAQSIGSKFDQQSNPLSANQGDSLDKDDGYLSSSRQTSTRYSSSCTDDNRPAVETFPPVNEGIQGKTRTYR